MGHSQLRKETNCLNCGATVQGRYCHVCGQENVEPKETLWHMVTHFFYDITHFDGSFFITVKDLFFKPGFLSREYMLGRRKKYLHPVRMYVFTSAVFFLVFFSLFHVSEKDIDVKNTAKLEEGIETVKDEAFKDAKTAEDSAKVIKALELLGLDNVQKKKADSMLQLKPVTRGDVKFTFNRSLDKYRSLREYDSLQNTLSPSERDKGITKLMMRKSIELNVKYEGDQRRIFAEFINTFLHSIPYLLFVSLPLFALYLRLLYFRRRREYYFADHAIFLIHLYIFTFLFFLLYFALDKLEGTTHWRGVGIIQGILMLAGVIYTIAAMKNFYRQTWGKTILKFILFNILCTVSILLLFAVFLGFSFFKI